MTVCIGAKGECRRHRVCILLVTSNKSGCQELGPSPFDAVAIFIVHLARSVNNSWVAYRWHTRVLPVFVLPVFPMVQYVSVSLSSCLLGTFALLSRHLRLAFLAPLMQASDLCVRIGIVLRVVYAPRTQDWLLPVLIGKGSRAVVKGFTKTVRRRRRGAMREYRGA